MGGPGSGAKPFEVNPDILLDLIERGASRKQIAEEVGCSAPTLRSKIAQLQAKSPVLLEYRALQTLELTELQSKILSNITDEKIDQAPLRDLVLAYKILKEKEFMVEGKPTEVKGLVHYLIEIERMEAEEKKQKELGITSPEEFEDATFEDVIDSLDNLDNVPLPEEVKRHTLKLEDLPD